MTTVFDQKNKENQTKNRMFFDGGVTLARYDNLKYQVFESLTDKQLGFFWRPDEVDVTRDSKDFKDLTPHEQHIFTSNLKRQILLDSVQGRAPSEAFLPVVSLPELEVWVQTWAFNETIHSRSYTHIIRNVYSDPSVIFDDILNIEEIVDCAKDISKYYDDLIEYNIVAETTDYGEPYFPLKGGNEKILTEYEHKRRLWLAINSVNALEGIRFYVSFACSWAFAELKKMEGNAKIIKFICRDENIHLASTQTMIKLLPKDDPDFAKISEECQEDVIEIFRQAVDQEKEWADFLFKDGSMIGLNKVLLCDYIEWIANRRMSKIGLPTIYKGGSNPLPWTQKWISGSDVQVAPQQTQITSYVVGGVDKDVDEDTFKGFNL